LQKENSLHPNTRVLRKGVRAKEEGALSLRLFADKSHTTPSHTSTLTPFSVWDIHTRCLKACNTAFQQMVGYTLEELQSNFFCSNLVSSSFLEDLNLLWEFLAVSYKRLELKLCLRRKEGYDFCVNTVMLVTPDHSSVVVEHDPVSLCDDKWKIGDFTHFPTLQVPPCDCRRNMATVQNIREFWNLMGASEKKWN